MARKASIRILALLFALLMLSPAGSAEETVSANMMELTGALCLPDRAQRSLLKYEDDNTLASLDLFYDRVTLPQLLKLMASLEDDGWCLRENGAFRYARGLAIDWNQGDAQLTLGFRKPRHLAEWPEAVPACLALNVPVFPGGVFLDPHTGNEPLRGMEAVVLKCGGVSLEEVEEYERTLVRAGYSIVREGSFSLLVRSDTFVVTQWDEDTDEVHLYLGWMPIQYAPLPPWPDPLPEKLKRMLSPLSAILTVMEEDGAYRAEAQGISLNDLYRFYRSVHAHYGWSEATDEAAIVHNETGWQLTSLSYDARAERWTALIQGPGTTTIIEQEIQGGRAAPSPSPQPAQRSENGLTRFALTEGVCAQDGIMETVLGEFGQTAVVADWKNSRGPSATGSPRRWTGWVSRTGSARGCAQGLPSPGSPDDTISSSALTKARPIPSWPMTRWARFTWAHGKTSPRASSCR